MILLRIWREPFMHKINLDTIINRYGTDSLKYDAATRRGYKKDILPLWVADMDFAVAPPIIEALEQRIHHGIFGYSEAEPERYFDVVSHWFTQYHHWTPQAEWLVQTPGIVFALAMAVRAFTQPGDAVLLQQPVYYPFSEVILDNDRQRVSNDLVFKDGRYTIDLEDFERKIITHKVKLFLLCSPHNPVGRVWTAEELSAMGKICRKHNVLIIADEIHADFVRPPHTHTVFASISQEFSEHCIVCTAPSKTFNIAGLQTSNIFIPNEALRKAFKKEIDRAGYSQLNTLGLVATEAAYKEGRPWLETVQEYLWANVDFVREFLAQRLPQIKLIEPEGTYLLWLDFHALHLSPEQLDALVINKANLWLDSGAIFGAPGEGFQRINIACPQSILQRALESLEKAIQEL